MSNYITWLRLEIADLGIENVIYAAQRGDCRSLVRLAYAHAVGFEVPKDEEKALKLAMLAAESGDGEAESLLGWRMTVSAEPNRLDSWKEAYKWYKRAADHGCSDGMLQLFE
jgi:TPR repeat protein